MLENRRSPVHEQIILEELFFTLSREKKDALYDAMAKRSYDTLKPQLGDFWCGKK